jgi:large subunit ribosomal protein L9
MQIILTKDVDKLGYANDIVEVKPGYANNYLIPQGYAKAATVSARKVLAENLKQRAHKDAKIQADAQAMADKLANLPLVFKVKAEGGKIFGSVTSQMVAEALAAKGVEIDRKYITVEAFKTVGSYTAEVRLHKNVKGVIPFTVEAEGAAKEAAAAEATAAPTAE